MVGCRLGNGLALGGLVVVDKTLDECGQGRVELAGQFFLGHYVDQALFPGAGGDGDFRGAGHIGLLAQLQVDTEGAQAFEAVQGSVF